MIERRLVFVAGGTGYLGRAVIPRLLERGHSVKALVRPGSESRLAPGATPVPGNALDRKSFESKVRPCDTYLQLVGVAHPSPSKAEEFRRIDLTSALASVKAARQAGVAHFVYLSVAQPAPAMKAYVEARAEAETAIRDAGLNATLLRPWYVLGPGHRWPALLWPGYWLAERFGPTRETARRIGLVTLRQMTAALVHAVETPATGIRVVEVPEIRKARL
jgi:uncharacterized protein YbjT (DUF2867 family)